MRDRLQEFIFQRSTALLGSLLLATVLVASSSTPAAAEPAPAPSATNSEPASATPTPIESPPSVPGSPVSPPAEVQPMTDELAALNKARESGSAVEVTSRTTETDRIVANPNGSFTATITNQPARVKRGNQWVPIDTTLVRQPDGTITPSAAIGGLRLSDGGDGPFATLSANANTEIRFSWPTSLSKPIIDGDTATYPEVFPGVDLKVVAVAAGFSELIVIKTREAASNPALAQIRLAMNVTGAQARKSASGGFEAVDPSGQVSFRAPTPFMWDADAEVNEATGSPSGNAAVSAMPLDVNSTSLTVIPDQTMLADPATTYPVTIDPTVTVGRLNWTSVWKKFPDQTYWNATTIADGDPSGVVRSGYEAEEGNTVRSLFQMNTAAYNDKHILSAEFSITNTHTWSCTATPIELWLVGGISIATTWNNQPSWVELNDTKTESWGRTGCSADRAIEFNATNAVQDAAANNWPSLTLGLRAQSETDTNQWKRFKNDAALTITYNTPPNLPSGLSTDPYTGCVTGASRPFITTKTPRLRAAAISDPDGGNLQAQFKVFNTSNVLVTSGYSSPVPSPSPAVWTVPSGKLADGGVYSFNVQGYDSTDWGSTTANCEFQIDATPPANPPIVSSTDYPANIISGSRGKSGTWTFTANGITDVKGYYYSINAPTTPTNYVAASSLGGNAALTVTPDRYGTNILYVQSTDRAGNKSPVATYTFEAGAGTTPTGYWRMNEGTGTTVADISGNNHTATLAGGATWTTDRTGTGAVALNGSTAYASTTAPVIATNTSFTVSTWVKVSSTSSYFTILSQHGINTSAFFLQYSPPPMNRWSFTVSNTDVTNPTGTRVDAPAQVTQNTWTHLTGVYDAGTKQIRLFVNGALAGVATQTATFNATGPFDIGRAKYNGAFVNYWPGAVDETRVWNRVVYSDELIPLINANLTQGRSATADSSCTTAEDSTKAVDGILINNSKWCSKSADRWLQVDLGAVRPIDRFVIRHAQSGGEPAGFNTSDFNILTSVDGLNWSSVVQARQNIAALTSHYLASPIDARYIKLAVLAGAQSGFLNIARIYEFEAYTQSPSTLTNVALYSEATADSSCRPEENPDKAHDSLYEDINDKWCSNGTEKWLQLDLGELKSITWFGLKHASAGPEWEGHNTRDYDILVSSDGVNWTTAVQARANTDGITGHPVDPAALARYVKLVVITPTQNTDGSGAARIYELEVYSPTL